MYNSRTSKLTKMVESTFQQVKMIVAFKAPKEIGDLFPFKDNIKDTLSQSKVVYQITCETCNQAYIGKTERIMRRRMEEHQTTDNSAIRQHLKDYPSHVINPMKAKILDRADSNIKLMVKEMLYINKYEPVLNTQHAAKYKNHEKGNLFNRQLNTIIIAPKIKV